MIVGITQIRLDALQEPSHLETLFATQAKHPLVGAEARVFPQHGESAGEHQGGTNSTLLIVQWVMAQTAIHHSERELFWNVKNGIRLSGMPTFRKVESDEHIWNLVHYVRALKGSDHPESGADTH